MYVQYLKEDTGAKPLTVKAARNFLLMMFPDPGEPITDLGPDHYATLRQKSGRRLKEDGKTHETVAAATHQRALWSARAMLDWCVGRGWLKKNALKEIKPMGRARKGKPQLRTDEARQWLAAAEGMAEERPGVLGALMCCLLAFRVSEVLTRTVRDLDNGGTVLWVEGKTDRGAIPMDMTGDDLATLRRLLRQSAKGKLPLAPLVDTTEFAITYWNRKICKAAGVPVVCPQSLRCLHSTLSLKAGKTPAVVAHALRHTEQIDRQHYAAAGAEAEGQRKEFLKAMRGGRSAVTDSPESVTGEGDE